MANLIESSTWESGIYQIETTDPVEGGSGGASNCQPGQLANRTKKIYDTLKTRGIFITPGEQAFVGQPVVISATFEGTVADGDMVYYHLSNTRFEKAIADGSAAQEVVGLADVTNSKVLASGLVATSRSDTPGDILFLSDTVAGAITTSDTGVPIARYQYSGIIFMAPAASAAAAAASIAPGSVTPDKLSEHYYTDSEIDAKCGNWDTAYTQTRQWDGGATGLVAATGRTSLELTGNVTTHCHDSVYYTETEIDTKCGNWDNAYTERRYWDGGATGLNASTGRTSLGLTGDVTTHCHDNRYYTESQIDAKCGNWDNAYTERRQWDGSNTNLNASTGRTSLGLTGDVTTHCHDNRYYTETESDNRYGRLSVTNTWTGCQCFREQINVQCSLGRSGPMAYIINNQNVSGCGAAIRGYSTGVYGCSCAEAAVKGNTAYCNTSSKYLKQLNDICITQCLKDNPLSVYKYYWEDSNYSGFNQTIGPVAEDFHNTFKIHHSNDADEHKGLYSVEGIALGLGIENMNKIEKMEKIIIELYSCIQQELK